jgi:hypothetical protein
VRRTGSALAANNGRNLRVSGVTATLLTFTTSDGLPITGGAADATGSLDIQKRVIQGNPVVRRSFTFEEYGADMDETELFIGGRIATMRMSGGPDQMATVEFGIVGADEQALLPAASPYFTAPTVPSGIGLTLADAVIRFGGVDVAVLTSADFTLDNRQAGQAVIGGGVTPDVFEGRAAITGSVSAIRQDLGYVRKYLAETELELQLLFVEPEAEPKDYISVFIPRIKLGTPTKTLGSRWRADRDIALHHWQQRRDHWLRRHHDPSRNLSAVNNSTFLTRGCTWALSKELSRGTRMAQRRSHHSTTPTRRASSRWDPKWRSTSM